MLQSNVGSELNSIELDGRVAIVTGAAGDIGNAISRRLASAGAAVALWDRDATGAEKLAKELGPSCQAFRVDITLWDDVARAAEAVEKHFGGIDILVNNAGVEGPFCPTWEIDPAQFRSVLDVNLIGAFFCVKALVPLMLKRQEGQVSVGRIVNISSLQGKEPAGFASAYSAAKAGLIALTKSLGRELAPRGLLVNCVTPTATESAMSRALPRTVLEEKLKRIPMGRLAKPDEIAALVVWLCSEECSFSTGAVFDVSGGRATY